jgi:hypothetical protein
VSAVADEGSLAAQLRALYERNGFVRHQNPERIASEGWRRYKKGLEVRLTVDSEAGLATVRRLLCEAGFTPGRPYRHGTHRFRQPLYGRHQVVRFLELIGEPQAAEQARQPDKASR